MIHFEGVNTWDVNIYLYYRMMYDQSFSIIFLCGHYSKKKEGEVVVCMFSFLRDIILFFYSFAYCVNHSRI